MYAEVARVQLCANHMQYIKHLSHATCHVLCSSAIVFDRFEMAKWPGCSRVQITCNTSSTYHVQHVMCCVAQLLCLTDLINFEMLFISALLPWLKPLSSEGEETRVPRENQWQQITAPLFINHETFNAVVVTLYLTFSCCRLHCLFSLIVLCYQGTACDLVTGEERRYASEDNTPSGHVACTVEMASVTTPCEDVLAVTVS